MGETKRQIAPTAASTAKSAHQQTKQSMQPLVGTAQVANAQQLEGPFIDGIKALPLAGRGIAAKTQRGERLDADSLTAEAVCAELIPRLQKGQGHPLGFLAGAIDAGHTFKHLNAAPREAQSGD